MAGPNQISDCSESLGRYLHDIATYPRLTSDQEKELGRLALAGDEEAIERLVDSNLRFVVSYAKRFRNHNVCLCDLINEGNLGLMQAARKFDPKHNVKFITYAVWWIRQAILHALAEQSGLFRLPQKQANLLYRDERARSSLASELEREPSLREVSDETGISLSEMELLETAGQRAVSLDAPIDEEETIGIGELLEQSSIPPTDGEAVRHDFEKQMHAVLDELAPKEREVLRLRFGFENDEPLTLREIGVRLHYSRERVRQIEGKALEKCRMKLKERSITDSTE